MLEDLEEGLGAVSLPQAQAVAAGLQVAERAGEEAKSFAYEVARQAGLTAEDDYRGWIPVLILLYKFVYPPVKTALQIETQTAAVLQQLYSWLGGVGKAIDNGAAALGSDIESGAEYIFSGRWL